MFDDSSRVLHSIRTFRHSSWDLSGRNHDYLLLEPGRTVTLMEERGPSCVPPTYPSTGTEEIFGGACPRQAYSGPYTGFYLDDRARA